MTLKLFRDFMRDHFAFTLVYFISHILVSIYCNYYISSNIQLMYLLSIYFYVFIIFLCFRFIKYVSANREIQRLSENIEIEEKGFSCEQQAAITLIHRIHQTYQDQIYEVKAQADNTHKFISQWIHNLKTPLSVIDLILQNYNMNSTGHAVALQHIGEEKDKILSMLNQMLKFFRLEHFTRDYTPEPVNLLESLRSLINSKRNQYIYNNVYPLIECEEESIMVMTDSKWNMAMLEQIVSNAIKYSDAGEETKSIHFHIERRGDQVVLSIRDEGIGIEKVDLQRVFQPFFTGKNGRTHHQATGIGLYVCSEIARKLGHRLSISSEVNQGTEVQISYLSKLKDSIM
ncbi:sensor histidine kinase [Paenibacillus graminis]|uniref:sensor histidine kinase n=1 Tax=Paenibacillus graminis TaxID=189425 RepID=UPI002DBCEBA0|nr:sensor histidine kinase [Paenibacillus graminis]MEC0169623.1 sensor histidine kinase [Paenibacillus graminis]